VHVTDCRSQSRSHPDSIRDQLHCWLSAPTQIGYPNQLAGIAIVIESTG
jgi:hypothetical protein